MKIPGGELMSVVRRLKDEEFDRFVDISANAYPAFKIVTQEDKQKLRDRSIKLHNEDPTINFYGLFRSEEMIGTMRFHDFTMKLLTVKAMAGGVGMVAVELLHKKEKAAKDMITYFIKHYKEKGVPMVLLYPFRPDFYKKMGFGFGTKMNQYKIKPDCLPMGNSREHIGYLNANDKQELLACYQRFVDKTNGMIERVDIDLKSMLLNTDNRVLGYKKDGRIYGYIIFSFKQDPNDNFLKNDIVIKEFVYETREALSELLTFLHTQDDQINRIIINTQDEFFHHISADPRDTSDNVIPSVYHQTNTQGVGLMYRVTDTRLLFNTLKDHNFSYQNCKLKLNIRDSFFSENNGSIIVHFENGTPNIVEENDYEAEVSMDVSDFSSLVMGVINFKTLFRYGLADISDESYVETVNRIFLTEEKPICMTAF
jgi:predicted acetyltransferase